MPEEIIETEEINVSGEGVSMEAESFKCPGCGGTLSFDIKSQEFMCRSCRAEYDIKAVAEAVKEYDFGEYRSREAAAVPYSGPSSVSCESCGAEIDFTQYQFANVCPMCQSTQIITAKVKTRIPPEGIVPFRVDKQDAQQRFHIWAKGRWFAPNDFKKSYGEGGLRGMYLPFWTFDSNAVSYYTGMGGKNRIVRDKEGKTRTVTDWFPVSGVVQNFFDDVLICSSDKEKFIERILPYRTTTGSVPYSAQYLSGYYAEIYKLKADDCFEKAKRIMDDKLRAMAEAQIRLRYDLARVTSMNTKHSDVTYKNMLLPLWGAVFGYKGKTYGYLINGETGKVSGERPYSIPKIAAAVIAGIIILITVYILTNEDRYSYDNIESPAVYDIAVSEDFEHIEDKNPETIFYYKGEIM